MTGVETLIIDSMPEDDNRFTYSTSSPSFALAANMATSQELSTFEHAKGLHACFLLTNTTAKFYYGRLLHNISWLKTDDKGTFLMSNGTVNTYSLKDIRRAIIRLTKGDPLWSEFKKGSPTV
jgi:hypothetical protein